MRRELGNGESGFIVASSKFVYSSSVCPPATVLPETEGSAKGLVIEKIIKKWLYSQYKWRWDLACLEWPSHTKNLATVARKLWCSGPAPPFI